MIDVAKLKAGDKIRRVSEASHISFVKVGVDYMVYMDGDSPYIIDEDGDMYCSRRLSTNRHYWEPVEPTQPEVGFFVIESITKESGEPIEVTIRTTEKGVDALFNLEQQSCNEDKIRRKDAEIERAERMLEELKRERKSME